MKDRETIDEALERQMFLKPFDVLPIFTGDKQAKLDSNKYRQMGSFKGYVCVYVCMCVCEYSMCVCAFLCYF